ncbi:ribosome biogenesis GTPase YlqF [Petrotoga sp. 9PWA.NaAc.5.4]|uniref:ribosome biogenesis GTPase YlqF n=1 Tax=Petrotoga sp. 9PWA.NaAc.5.4 TaxID=1434328 RepID=UPI000CB0D48C|nr:ribosome biogenesis GTPase YlqF [Petrotoga sp. 9PWA.NaAc.5.4]PNR96718.1 GTP-binding protein [Petrotoga sp. 9PWA.NaAc.5.4]
MWYPGHIEKAKKIIKNNLSIVNAVIEILDARAPYASRAYEEEQLFRNKNRIIVLNKYDLCDKKKTKEWENYYKANGNEVFSLSLKNLNLREFFLKKIDPLIPEKFNEKRIMIVGIPNVGKSTFINRLKGKKAAAVGNEPGITRGIQWINIGEKLRVLDTPGVLYPKLYNKNIVNKLILIGSLKSEDHELEEAFNYAFNFLRIEYPEILSKVLLNWEGCKNSYEFIELFSLKRNFIKKGGIFDYERGRNIFLKELSDGKYGCITYETPSDF